MKDTRAAAVQFTHRPGDKAANLETVRIFTAKAAVQGVELLVFPEMCVTGYWHLRNLSRDELQALAEPVPSGPSTRVLLELAAKYNLSVGAGFIEIDDTGKLYNSYVVAMPNGRHACHRKLHCFISGHMVSGIDYTVFELPNDTRAGILICYDNNLFENTRIVALKGAEVLIAPHQTGGCRTPSPGCMGAIDPELWENRRANPYAIENEFKGRKGREWLLRWLPSRAHDNGMFLIFSNGVGIDDGEVRTGNSMILDPYGDILAETWKAEETMVVADLEADRLRMTVGMRWIKTRRPDLYGSLTESTGREEDVRKVRFDFGESKQG